MSGNIGEKARAAFLALIMVTSVMAAGVAFSGSAAAQSIDGDITDGSVIADNADAGASARHVYRIDVGSGDLGDGDNLKNITITTQNVDFTTIGSLNSGENDVDISNDGDINVFVDGSAVEDDNDNTVLDIAVQSVNGGSNNQLVLGSADGTDSDAEDFTNTDYATTLNDDSTVTVELGGSAGITNPSSSDNVNATIGDSGGQEGSINEMSLNLDGDAPITVFNSDGTIASNHSVFASAASAVDSTGENIKVEGAVDNVDPTGSSVFSSTTISDQDNLAINGSGSVTVDGAAAPIVDVDNNDGLTVDGLTFNGTNNAATLVDVGTGTSVGNASITNNVFNQTTGDAVTLDLDEGDDDDPATNELTGNEFSDVSEAVFLRWYGCI
jgi:surface glycoprotein (TIGR04207 family)